MEDKKFTDFFYESVQIFSTNLKLLIPILICATSLNVLDLVNTGNQNDADRIILAIFGGLLSTVFSVFTINVFASKLNGYEFSLSKSMWDIPTYLISELGFGLLVLASAFLLIIPAFFVYFFYMLMPVIAIAFDHLDTEDIGSFAMAKKIAMSDKSNYTIILILGLVVVALGLGIERIYINYGQNFMVAVGLSLIFSLMLIINTGILISFVSQTYKKSTNVN